MAVIVRDKESDNEMVVNTDGSINVKLEATPTIDIGDVQMKGETSTGDILPIKVTDDGSGLGKLVCSIE